MDDNNKLIDDFLSNRLSQEERVSFEERLATDPGLVDELAFNIATQQELKKSKLKEIRQKTESIRRKFIIFSIMILLGIPLVIFLIATIFSPNDVSGTIAKVLADELEEFEIAGTTWRNDLLLKKYEDAAVKMEAELAKLPERCMNEEISYYLGIIYLYKGKYAQAEEHLFCSYSKNFKLEKTSTLLFGCYLMQGKKIEAKSILDRHKPIQTEYLTNKMLNRSKLLDLDF